MLQTLPYLEKIEFPALKRDKLEILQVNLGYLCNLQCLHCHVNAGPKRKEIMTRETIDEVIGFLRLGQVSTLDLTGGAPEMNPHFRHLVSEARQMGVRVIDRCNLTVLMELPWLGEFLAAMQVEVVASLPCYLRENVDAQRGKGSYDASIEGLHQLNGLGYGRDADKVLNLVYNPQGASLPPPQEALESDYKTRLQELGISFNHLLTITNMPINRFGSMLLSKGEFNPYMELLQESHQDSNLQTVMCRSLTSVDWQGYLYDCDFNQLLDLPMNRPGGTKHLHLTDLHQQDLNGWPIVVRGHCYGCTAGQGSSCSGALE